LATIRSDFHAHLGISADQGFQTLFGIGYERLTATPSVRVPIIAGRMTILLGASITSNSFLTLSNTSPIAETHNLLLPVVNEDWHQPRNERRDAHDQNDPEGRRWAVAHLGNEEEAALLWVPR